MQENGTDSSPLENSVNIAAHTAQAAYAVSAAAQGGMAAAGAATGTALAGPLGTVVGALVSSKIFWKIVVGIFLFLFLWMFIIANLIGIILTFLGFADADSFANEAQSAQMSNLRARVELVMEKESYAKEIHALLVGERDRNLQEIQADQAAHYAEHELVVVDEYETKLKRNISHYLAVMLAENCDRGTLDSFLGYENSLGLDMSTNLSSPYDAYFHEAARTYNVPAALLIAMAKVESEFIPNVVSGAGAIGIMQLMPSTAAGLGVSDPYDPYQNIMGGAKYIAQNIEQFRNYSNGLELAIAAYNAGPNAVVEYGYQIPPYKETQDYVKKVLGYVSIQEQRTVPADTGESSETDGEVQRAYEILKEEVEQNLDRLFSWSVTDEKETESVQTIYYTQTENGRMEIEKAIYDQLLAEGGNVWEENQPVQAKRVEYTLALMLNAQPNNSVNGYQYRFVTNEGTFNLIIRVLELMQDGIEALRNGFFSLFRWTDFITGGSGAGDSYFGNIDASGDIITYDTVENCQRRVVYYNQGEEPWGSMPYGTSTIGAAGCGPTSMAIVISTLTGQTVNPQMTCAYSISNGEYVSGVGTAHSFPTNAAHHWGLTCERVGKDRMGYVVQSLKEGKMVVEICEAYTITGSGSGHFIVLTGVTRDGYITIADCASRERTGKVYSVETITSYGRDLAEGAFWIIGK
ncbi:transglycosylase SLT domain-containing protein [Parablautia sp. Marseille-Q6255]|uniref:transglycosylase SLT domain-containing protein n=1 Tax=Parablautia sp. Marseille-Q6255 TaxID=3039593 RepID=UPI0024BD22AA|nr:transglycosylase SLT domain-containing protein [Parablautia sp. Marseille-Q6255]